MLELLPVKTCGDIHYLNQSFRRVFCFLQLNLTRPGLRSRFCCTIRFWMLYRNLKSDPGRKLSHCFDKMHAPILHHETNGITVSAATKTVIKLLGGAHGERGRFFAVKWTTRAEICTSFLERHVTLDDVNNVNAVKQFLDE